MRLLARRELMMKKELGNRLYTFVSLASHILFSSPLDEHLNTSLRTLVLPCCQQETN